MIEIVVLSQPDCHFCELAEEILGRVGQDYPLTVRKVRLDSDEGQLLAVRHGVLFAPGVLLDGRLLSYGRLSERLLRRHLERRPLGSPSPNGDRVPTRLAAPPKPPGATSTR
jgi:hypothetical protein